MKPALHFMSLRAHFSEATPRLTSKSHRLEGPCIVGDCFVGKSKRRTEPVEVCHPRNDMIHIEDYCYEA